MDLFVLSSFPQPPLSHLDGDDQRSSPYKLGKRLIVGITTCVLALVGAPIGAVIGALIGIPTETGFLRGAGTGAIAGAVFSVEVVESSVALWRSHEHGIYSNILYVVDILCSLLSGRLVREKVGRALQRAVQSQQHSGNVKGVCRFASKAQDHVRKHLQLLWRKDKLLCLFAGRASRRNGEEFAILPTHVSFALH